MTSCDFRTSEAATKSWFRTRKLIDSTLNILDLAGFRKANTKWSNYARITFGVNDRLFLEENNGTKAIPNSQVFQQIDAKKGIFYEKSTKDIAPNIELENKLKSALKGVGVNVAFLDNIRDNFGKEVLAIAKADMIQGVVEVVEGKRSINTIPEEAAHIFFELLPDEHPLKLAALKKAMNSHMFNEVKAEYGDEYSDETGVNEEMIAKETVGKLIAQEIIGLYSQTSEPESIKSWMPVWFKSIVNYLRARFRGVFTGAKIAEMSNPYRDIAQGILDNTLELRSIEEVKAEYRAKPLEAYFYELAPDVKAQVQRMKDKLNSIPPLTRTKGGYLDASGKLVPRVSDTVDQYYKQKFKTKINPEEYEHSRLKGDVIHKIQQTLMQDLIDGNKSMMSDVLERSKKNLLTEVEHAEVFQTAYKKYGESLFSIGKSYQDQIASFVALQNTVQAIYNNVQANQAKINTIFKTNEKAEILLEKTVYDPNRNIAGTLDLIVIYSNGAVGRYDYKSLDITEKRYIPSYKEEAWEIQLDGYTRILADAYGVNKFAESRIVPIGVKFDLSSKNATDVLSFETANSVAEVTKKKYLSYVPLNEYTVVNENVNKALKVLYTKKDLLRKKLREASKSDARNKVNAELNEISDNIKKLVFDQDYKFIMENVDDISKDFHNQEVAGNITNKYLSETLDELRLYADVIRNLKGEFTTSEDFTKPENASIIIAESLLGSLTTKVENKIKDLAAEYTGINVANPGRELGYFGRQFSQLSDINHPAFKALTTIVRETSNKTREAVNTVFADINAKKKALEDLAKSKGVSLQSMYDKLIKSDGKNLRLINRISETWYKGRDEAIKTMDFKWFANNTQVHAEGNILKYNGEIQTRFDEFRVRKEKELAEIYKGKRNDARRNEELDKFDRKFNVSKYDSALLNKDNFFVKATEDAKHFTEEWKYLIAPENKALKDFYDTLTTYNKEFASMTGGEIKHNFIPRIKQDMIQRLGQNGIASVFEMRENILNSMEVRQNDIIKGNIDPTTGEPIASIPLLYTDSVGSEVQSRDLAQNLILFAGTAYSYKNLAETEHLVKNIRTIIASPEYKTILTDAFGKPKTELGQVMTKNGIPSEDLAAFDTYVKQIYYGQMFTGKDWTFKLGEKEYSGTKGILALHKFMTLKSLGLNPISSAGNAIGAYSNLLSKSTEGKYFSPADIKNSIKLTSTDNEKYHAIIEMFQPQATSVTRDLANKIAASSVEKNLTMEKMLFMMKNPDEQLENIVLLSMMQNYGIKDGKIVKNAEDKLIDLFVKDSKGNYTLDIPKSELYRFRQMVIKVGTQIKGSIPQDDKMLISSNIMGYSMMFFKNWIIPLGKDKFGKLRFDNTMQEFEAGKMYIAGQQILKGGFKDVARLLQEFAFMGGLKKINTDIAARYLDEYIDNTPELQDKLAKGEVTRDQLLKDYIELRHQKLKGAITDLRMLLGWFAIAMLLKSAIPDDDEKDWAKLLAQNGYMMANRGWLETSFFLSPASANQIISQPIMLYGLVSDFQTLAKNTFDESRDILFGEESNRDKSPLMYYTVTKFLPFGRPISQVTDMFDSFKTK